MCLLAAGQHNLLKLREQRVGYAVVQLVQVVDQLLGTDLGRLGAAVYSVIALLVLGVHRLDLGLLVTLFLEE